MNESSKQLYSISIIAIVSLALLNGIALYYTFSKTYQPQAVVESGGQANVISVSGTGAAYANPDMVHVSITVLTQAAAATEAQDRNSDLMRNVIDALKRIGVADGDVRTEQYSLRPIYNYEKEPKIVSYECRNSLRVTWRKISEVGTVLDAAVKAGANNIGAVTFALSQQKVDALTNDAIRSAVADADAKAQAIASALKVRIVGKVSASIGTPYTPAQTTYELKAGTPIVPGELQVTVTAYVSYRFS